MRTTSKICGALSGDKQVQAQIEKIKVYKGVQIIEGQK